MANYKVAIPKTYGRSNGRKEAELVFAMGE
jgi:hypothetical protein